MILLGRIHEVTEIAVQINPKEIIRYEKILRKIETRATQWSETIPFNQEVYYAIARDNSYCVVPLDTFLRQPKTVKNVIWIGPTPNEPIEHLEK